MKVFLKFFIFLLIIDTICANAGTYSMIERKLKETMQITCNDKQFSGAVLVAVDNEIIFQEACGFANRGLGTPNDLHTKFNLGSVGKLFTAIAIAQLIQENKISLSTQAYKIIPTWLLNTEQEKITIEQLLIHASGFGNFMDDKRWKLGADSGLYVTVNQYKPLIQDDKLLFTPGKSQHYSNNSYILLGAIIEAITDENYFDYLEKNIFKPAGMINTGIWALDEIIPNRSEGYFQICKNGHCRWKNNNFEIAFTGSPAGGAYSTVGDLFQFSQYLHKYKLLSKEFTQQVLTTDTMRVSNSLQIKSYRIDDTKIFENFSPHGFAGAWNKYGFAVWENPSLVGHTGGSPGASALFVTSPDGKYTIIILSNIGGSGPLKLYKKIRETLGFSEKIINY